MLDVLFAPERLLFTVPILLAGGFGLLAALGMVDLEGADADLDLDAEFDADVDLDADASTGGFASALGLGLVPMSVFATVFLFAFGWLGLALLSLMSDLLGMGWSATLLAAPVAGLGAAGVSAAVARGFAPLFRSEGRATGARELVGRTAVVTSSTVSTTFGTARVETPDGHRIEVSVRAEPHHELHYGQRAVVYGYQAENGLYLVGPLDDEPAETLSTRVRA